MGKKNIYNLTLKNFVYLNLWENIMMNLDQLKH